MPVEIVVGLNCGDEAKGKLNDTLLSRGGYSISSRFNGSSNAGHTIVVNDHKYKLHMLPDGVLNKGIINILAPGVFVNPKEFLLEKEIVEKISGINPEIYISEKCQVVLPHHIDFNKIEEQRLGKKVSGSTCRGTTPCAVDFVNKSGIRMYDLLNDDKLLFEKIKRQFNIKKSICVFYRDEEKTIDDFNLTTPEETYEEIKSYKKILKPFVKNTDEIFQKSLRNKEKILFGAQLGFSKDLYFGQYPEISSSSCLAAHACVSSGLPTNSVSRIYGVLKAYDTMVGSGIFPTELHGEEAHELREINGEYGATSGKPRRVGRASIPPVRKAIEVNGCTDIALMLLDVLGYYEKIPVCVSYEYSEGYKRGQVVSEFPIFDDLKNVKPIYEILDGWKCDISNIRKYEDLPINAKKYIECIENFIKMPIRYISVGKERGALIDRFEEDYFFYDRFDKYLDKDLVNL